MLFVWRLSADYTARQLSASGHAQQYSSSTAARVERACGRVERSAFYECVAEQIAASREDQRDERDLSAQQDMADWAFWMMLANAVTMIVTAWALWYIKGTLDATKAAGIQAQEAADFDLRPWLQIEVQMSSYLVMKDRAMLAFYSIIKNIGRTPAYDVRVFTKLLITTKSCEAEIKAFFDDPEAEEQSPRILLPQGEARVFRRADGSLTEAAEAAKDKARPLIPHPLLAVLVLYSRPGTAALGKTGMTFTVNRQREKRIGGNVELVPSFFELGDEFVRGDHLQARPSVYSDVA